MVEATERYTVTMPVQYKNPLDADLVEEPSVHTCRFKGNTLLTISPPLPPLGFVESVADNVSETGFSRQWAFPVWEAETLHCF